jgi:hypothetical protein
MKDTFDELSSIHFVLIVLRDDTREDTGSLDHVMLRLEDSDDVLFVLLIFGVKSQRSQSPSEVELLVQLSLHD